MESQSSDAIKKVLLTWKGVTAHEHNFVSTIFYFNDKELGHLHGDSIADLQFPKKISQKLVSEGKVSPHHVISDSGWVSHEIRTDKDLETVIELFRFQYQRLKRRM